METEQPQNIEELKKEIIIQLADLSRQLGMMPGGDITVCDARASFLKLSVLVSKALDIELP